MKDVISILQSRIAKRENIITQSIQSECYTTSFSGIVEDQKQDKRILAEIVKLRRAVKGEQEHKNVLHKMHLNTLEKHSKYIKKLQEQLKKETVDEIMVVLNSTYEPAEIDLPKDFVELLRLGER